MSHFVNILVQQWSVIFENDGFGLKWNRKKNRHRLGKLTQIKSRFKRGVEIGSKIGSTSKNWCLHTFPSMKCDHKKLVILFHGVWYRIQCWLRNREKNLVKIPGSLLNQKVKWNYSHEAQDHFQAQAQFREKDNLPKC